MAFCFSKIDGKLNFNDLGGYETRNPSTIWCIKKDLNPSQPTTVSPIFF